MSPIVRRIVKSKSKDYFHKSKGISFITIRDEFKKHISPFVDDIASYGTHIIKSGTASISARRKINEELLDNHAGWKCASTKRRYIKYTAEDL